MQRDSVSRLQARSDLSAREGILLDWDGCVAFSDVPHQDGLNFLRQFRDRIAIVSNSSTIRPKDICRILAQAGIHFPVERVILAGHQALVRAAELQQPTLIFGGLQMIRLARELGVSQVKRDPRVIVLMRDTRFSYEKLCLGANAIRGGAHLIVSNPDLTHPGQAGQIVPETGALLAAFQACVPRPPASLEIIGKPNATLFEKACMALGIGFDQAIMIGDNPMTDIVGAEKLNMTSILVSPGSSLTLGDLCQG
jgi:HAD superfamily hydrolase (TIGR01450 family)